MHIYLRSLKLGQYNIKVYHISKTELCVTTSLIPLCIVNFFVLVKIANLVTLPSNKQHGVLVVVVFFVLRVVN